jgi:hypothetical protein
MHAVTILFMTGKESRQSKLFFSECTYVATCWHMHGEALLTLLTLLTWTDNAI